MEQKPAKRTEGENQGSVVSLKIRWCEFYYHCFNEDVECY